MVKDSKKKEPGSCPGFSKRFNQLLDLAGYPSFNQGRLTVLAEDLNMSMAGARKWIVEDTPPRGSKLVDVCEMLAKEKLSKRYNPRRIACWLEYGEDIVPNPFSNPKSIEKDHAIMGNIYVLVHNKAKKLKIDIYTMDSQLIDEIYKELMEDVMANKLKEPSKALISSLLVQADKKQKDKKQGH